MKELFNSIKAELVLAVTRVKQIVYTIGMRRLKARAMRLHRRHNCQYFVVKLFGKVRLISRQGFKDLRQHKKIPLSYTILDLKRISYFYTPARCYDKKGV